jgi:hypothetical protein
MDTIWTTIIVIIIIIIIIIITIFNVGILVDKVIKFCPEAFDVFSLSLIRIQRLTL